MTGRDAGDEDEDALTGLTAYFDDLEFPPPSATVKVTVGAQSCRGRSRSVNEDHYLVVRLGRYQETLLTSLPEDAVKAPFDEAGYAMVVADGMGDGGAGEAASHLAIATLLQLVRHFGKWNLRIDEGVAREILARADRFYRHVDSAVTYQRRRGLVATDRTTLTATFGAGRDLFLAHVGHSRAYLFRRGQLLRLTRDHTVPPRPVSRAPVAPLVDVSDSARDLKHILTQTMGMYGPSGPSIDVERMRLEDDDRVLVCTNGLTDMIDEPQIAAVLALPHEPQKQSQTLVDLAMAAGGHDDVTALIAWYRIPR